MEILEDDNVFPSIIIKKKRKKRSLSSENNSINLISTNIPEISIQSTNNIFKENSKGLKNDENTIENPKKEKDPKKKKSKTS